ncbi:MAG: DHH domain-containing protein [Ignavibacteria bacterium]|nr:MAG: DHH domain-containing protein [Ignavibacteria bacterium]KAF0161137.1 MAG: DHH domain-containing protein [Ignavibacteria bacterium]
MNTFSELKRIIEENKSFLLTTHVNPDADALGSELAFYSILKKLGKLVRIVNHSSTPYNLEFMDETRVIEKFDPIIHNNLFEEVDVCVVLDLNNASRTVTMEKSITAFKGIKICIDHHLDPEEIFNLIVGGTDYSATGEILFKFIKETNIVEIDSFIAKQLYVAIMTDTGSFRFERTTAEVHHIAAKLITRGVNPTLVYDQVYNQFNFGRVRLLGEALSTIQLDETKQIAFMVVTKEMLERNNTSEADVDGFVNYCLTISSVEIGILFYELKDGIKISFRSKGEIAVNKLAAEFSGGGHSNASGTRLFNTTIDEVKNKVIAKTQHYLIK